MRTGPDPDSGPGGPTGPADAGARLGILRDLARRLAHAHGREEVAAEAAAALERAVGGAACFAFERGPAGDLLPLGPRGGRPSPASPLVERIAREALQAGDVVLESDGDHALGVPIAAGDEPLGVLVLESAPDRPLAPADGELAGVVAAHAALALERHPGGAGAEGLYRSIVERIPVVTYVDAPDRTSSTLYISPQIERLLGTSPEQWLADPELWMKLLHPADLGRVVARHLETNMTGERFELEYRMVTRDGRVAWVSDQAVLVRDDEGRPLYWQGVMIDITERKETEAALRESNALLNGIIDGSADPVFVKDLEGRILLINDAGAAVAGRRMHELFGKTAVDLFGPKAGGRIMRHDREAIEAGTCRTDEETFMSRGALRTFLVTRGPYRDEDGTVVGLIGIARDITERTKAEEEQRRRNEYLAALHETALAALRRLDVGATLQTIVERATEVVDTEHAYAYLRVEGTEEFEVRAGVGVFTKWLGFRIRLGEGLAGRIAVTREPLVVEDYDTWDGRSPAFPREVMHGLMGVPLLAGDTVVGVIGLAHVEEGRGFTDHDVELMARFADIASVALENARLYAALERELRQRAEAEEKLTFLAYHDRLTGLPNRSMFHDMLEFALARGRRRNVSAAVLYLDVDGFKAVNDALGHAGGDEVLREVASRVRRAVRETDVVARHGGDEFLVLLADLDRRIGVDGRPEPFRTAHTVAERIRRELASPIDVGGAAVPATVSIGVAVFPDDASDAQSLVREADADMYRAKRARGGRQPDGVPEPDAAPERDGLPEPDAASERDGAPPPAGPADAATPDGTSQPPVADSFGLRGHAGPLAATSPRLTSARELRLAVERREWVLHFQPVVRLSSGEVTGVEALVRWRRPGGRLVGPSEFIPRAEEMGLIHAIGDWVVEELAIHAASWRSLGIDLEVSFNLSPRQLLDPALAERVAERLGAAAGPGRVVAEVTESATMSDLDGSRPVLVDLHERGIRLAIDDFGTGHSSLSRLAGLPISVLKIDRPFLRSVPADAAGASMLRGIIDLARGLGVEPVAEGVETEEQRRFLIECGCDRGQGYHFSPPVSARKIPALVADPSPLPGPSAPP